MNIYYLYIKTHKKTGLKYLGQTSKQNPYEYYGSGTDWKKHLNEFGYLVDTEILAKVTTKKELNQIGRYYSNFYKITTAVDNYGNRIWANRIPETGGGGSPNEKTIEKLRLSQLGKKKPQRTESHKENLSKSCKGVPKPRSKEHQDAWNKSSLDNWVNNTERKKQVSDLGKSNKGRKHTPEALKKKRKAMLEYWKLKKSHVV